MKKRLLASLMALCLIVGLLPTAVLAVEAVFPAEPRFLRIRPQPTLLSS